MKPVVLVLMLLISGCKPAAPPPSLSGLCLPPGSRIIDHQQPADFDLYRVEWKNAQFGLYLGDFPDFDPTSAQSLPIPIDAQAKFLRKVGHGEVLLKANAEPPRYLHLSGPCESASQCLVLDFAQSLKRFD